MTSSRWSAPATSTSFDRASSTPATTRRCWPRIRMLRLQRSGRRSTDSSRSAQTPRRPNCDTVAPPWVRDANLDPRLRVAAGLGGEVVRQNQDRYVEEAWRQVGDVLGANASSPARRVLAGRQRDAPQEMDLAALGRRPRDVDGARFTRACSSAENLTITGRLRQSPLPPSIVSVEYRRVTRARGSRAGAAAWRAAVGPAALASRSAAAQPLKVAVALDTIDTIEAPSRVWGVAAAPAILARLVPDLDQTGLTAAQAATQLDSLSQLAAVDFATADAGRVARRDRSTPTRVLTAVGMLPRDGHRAAGACDLARPRRRRSRRHAWARVAAHRLITQPTGWRSTRPSRRSLSSAASMTITPSAFHDWSPARSPRPPRRSGTSRSRRRSSRR